MAIHLQYEPLLVRRGKKAFIAVFVMVNILN
eukprot:CAMPEP_0197038778 /NCGR_PEP_ID=MMETSP1384-20130603/15672_1 /TAXON_ID=29189 /ORGANISM="Ammonia sp." /LENGTH=30 /DNA_ID= /DNA_START= /DNA_END= /DNA_ORIENTATION=